MGNRKASETVVGQKAGMPCVADLTCGRDAERFPSAEEGGDGLRQCDRLLRFEFVLGPQGETII